MTRLVAVLVIIAAFFAWYLRPVQVVGPDGCAREMPVPGVLAKARVAWKLGELLRDLQQPIPEEKVREAVNGTGQVLSYWWTSFRLALQGRTDMALMQDEKALKQKQAERDARCAPVIPGFGGTFGGAMTVGTWNVQYGSPAGRIVPKMRDLLGRVAVVGTQEMSPGMRAAVQRIPGTSWTSGNAVPIGWRTDLFTVVEQGRKSALRNRSVEGNDLTKQITWVVLRDRDGNHYAIVNTHMPYNVESSGVLQAKYKPRRIAAYYDQLAIWIEKMTELKRYGFVAGTCDCNIDYSAVMKQADQDSPIIQMQKRGFYPQQKWLGEKPTHAKRSIDYSFSNQIPSSWITLDGSPADHRQVLVGYGANPDVQVKA